MRKYIIVLLTLIMVAVLMTGCGKEVKSEQVTEQSAEQTAGQSTKEISKMLPSIEQQQETVHSSEASQVIVQPTVASSQTVEQSAENTMEHPTIKIAVIDTGFSPLAIPAENIVEGKNYLYPEKNTDDTYGHGTAIASIILRYAPDALLVPLVSNAYEDGKISRVDNATLAQMIVDAVDVYECHIINISAGLVLDKEVVREAIAYAEEQNVLVVASAGNDYELNGAVKYYPAAYDTVLAVGSLNEEGTEISTFSQRGEWVDLFAIGEEVTIGTLSGNTRTSDGTSYSAAKISALAATLMRKEEEINVQQLREKIMEEVVYINCDNLRYKIPTFTDNSSGTKR